MIRNETLGADEIAELDRIYREGGLRNMALPHIHYQEPLTDEQASSHVKLPDHWGTVSQFG